MDEDRSGVYTITNTVNGKVYIGSTGDFDERWTTHRKTLRLGTHYNIYLQRSWNKYGENVFEFMVLEYVNDIDRLPEREQYWMDFYRLCSNVYNIALVVGSPMRGRTMPEEQRRKISEKLMGHPVSEESKRKTVEKTAKSYPALIHKETGESIPAGTNILALSRELGLNEGHLRDMLSRKACSCQGWRLLVNPRPYKNRSYPAFVHKDTGEVIPAGENLSELCRRRGLTEQGMGAIKRGEYPSHCGWTLLKPNL